MERHATYPVSATDARCAAGGLASDAIFPPPRDLQDELAGTRRLLELGVEMIGAGDLNDLHQKFVEAAVSIMDADFGSFQMLSRGPDGREQLRLLANHGFTDEAARYWRWVGCDSQCGCAAALRTGRRAIVPDVEVCEFIAGSEDLEMFRNTDIRSLQTTPLYSPGGKLLGMLSTNWRTPYTPSDDQLRMFDTLARLAVGLIEREQATERLRADESRQAFFLKLSDSLRRIADPLEIQSEACRLVGEHLQVNRASYADIDGDRYAVRASFVDGVPPLPTGPTLFVPLGKSLVEAFKRSQVVAVDDVASETLLTPEEREIRKANQVAAFVSVMLPRGRRWVGAFAVHSNKPRHWSEADIRLVEEVADRIWAAVERARTEDALRDSERRLDLALKAGKTAVWEVDIASQALLPADGLLFAMLGYAPGQFRTLADWLSRLHPDDKPRIVRLFDDIVQGRRASYSDEEIRFCTKDGHWRWILCQATAAERDAQGRALRLVGTHTDIDGRKRAEEQLRTAALHDPLTGLPNRALVFEYGSHLIAAAERSHGVGALLFVDLDRFKPINDQYGHEIGDRVLQQVGRRLSECTRSEDLVGRLGGDEFVIILAHLDDGQRAAVVAQHVLERVGQPLRFDSLELSVSPSIGISYFPEHANDVEGLLHAADLAMYRAKHSGRSNYQIYTPAQDKRSDSSGS